MPLPTPAGPSQLFVDGFMVVCQHSPPRVPRWPVIGSNAIKGAYTYGSRN